MTPSTQAEAFAMFDAASGGTCFIETDGPALVNEIAMILYPDGTTELVSDYLAAHPEVFA
jgi:hypothetical protein